MNYCIKCQLGGKEFLPGSHRYSPPAHRAPIFCFCCSTHGYFRQERSGHWPSGASMENVRRSQLSFRLRLTVSSTRGAPAHGAAAPPVQLLLTLCADVTLPSRGPCLLPDRGCGLSRQRTLGGESGHNHGEDEKGGKETGPHPNFIPCPT